MFKRLKAELDNVSLWKKGIVVVSIPLVVLVMTLVLMGWHAQISREAQSRIRRSLEVKASIYKVLALLTDSETAVRGYMLWDDPVYLQPYNESRNEIENSLQKLEIQVKENHEQFALMPELRKQVFIKGNSLEKMLKNPASDSPRENEVTLESLDSMMKSRSILLKMEETEKRLLDIRIREYDQILARLNVSFITLFILAILGGLTASYIVSYSILKRVNRLEKYARRVSRGQMARWKDSGEDELGLLGRSVSVMTSNLLAREEALRQTREQLEEANVSIGTQLQETRLANNELESFSYSVSHDLRAPLRHIAGFAELMRKNPENLDPKNERYLKIIETSVGQMGTMIDGLLSFSRMSRTPIKADSIDLNTIISEVLTNLASEIQKRHIVWKVDTLPTVKGDPSMIRLVFQNLIGNAIKYSRKRDPAVIEVRETESDNLDSRKILISDNGAGFDMKYQDKLFSVFQRLHSSEEFEGSGIGLATVRRIVNRHGGEIHARGEVGKGATFTVTLPANE